MVSRLSELHDFHRTSKWILRLEFSLVMTSDVTDYAVESEIKHSKFYSLQDWRVRSFLCYMSILPYIIGTEYGDHMGTSLI